MAKRRLVISLDDQTDALLRTLALAGKCSEAEVCRQALIVYGRGSAPDMSSKLSTPTAFASTANYQAGRRPVFRLPDPQPAKGVCHITAEQYSAMKPSEQLRALREGRGPAGAIAPTEPA